jgi:hypothetical protein
MTKILITRPNFDVVTSYFHFWGGDVLKLARAESISIMDLEGPKATRDNVDSYLTRNHPSLVLLNGHGSPSSIAGHKNETLVDVDTARMLNGTIIYTISCSAAKELGPEVIRKGGIAFIGYEEDFGFTVDLTRDANPAKDHLAEPFMRASNAVSEQLLKGDTVRDACQKSQLVFNEEIRRHAVSDAQPENKAIRFWLFWDMIYQKSHGEPTATIFGEK